MYIDDPAKEKFSNKVLDLVQKTNLSFMQCVLEAADMMGIEANTAGKLLTKPIIEKIEIEAKKLNLLKKLKKKTLPVD